MARAVFGEVGVSPFVAGRALRDIFGDSRARNVVFFHTKSVSMQDGTNKVSEAAGVRWRFHAGIMVGSWSDYPRIVFIFGGCNSRIFRSNLELRFSWQAQYLVKLVDDTFCSAHCK